MPEQKPTAPTILTRPLNHVEMRFDGAQLGEGMSLRRATEEDAQQLAEAAMSVYSLPLLGGPKAGMALAELVIEPGEPDEEEVRERFNRLMLALRVLKEGGVSFGEQFTRDEDGRWKREFLLPPLGGDYGFFGPQYVLYAAEVDRLSLVYRGLASTAAILAVPKHRFDLGCRRSDRSDRFIDWWVALESLFGDMSEITYKLSLRIAYFVEKGIERPSLARSLRNAYAARSKVVHGHVPRDIEVHERVTVDVLRTALQRVILAGRGFEVPALDDYIAKGGDEPYPIP